MPAARRAPHRLPRTRSRAPRPREPAAPRPPGDSVRARALVAQAAGARWREPAALRAPRRVGESRAGPLSPGTAPGAPPSAAHGVEAAGPAGPVGRRLARAEVLAAECGWESPPEPGAAWEEAAARAAAERTRVAAPGAVGS